MSALRHCCRITTSLSTRRMLEVLSIPCASAAVIGSAYLAPPVAIRRLQTRRLDAVCRRLGCLALTYDDGPGELTTPCVLDALEDNDAKATFFMLGSRAAAQEPIARLVKEAGHDIGSHTFDHSNAWTSAPWRHCGDIARGIRSVASLQSTSLFRPPYGKQTSLTILPLMRQGATVCWWTVDSRDTRPALPTPDEVLGEVQRRRGAVVLMHDFDREGDDAQSRRAYVLELTSLLLAEARRAGMPIMTMSQLMDESRR